MCLKFVALWMRRTDETKASLDEHWILGQLWIYDGYETYLLVLPLQSCVHYSVSASVTHSYFSVKILFPRKWELANWSDSTFINLWQLTPIKMKWSQCALSALYLMSCSYSTSAFAPVSSGALSTATGISLAARGGGAQLSATTTSEEIIPREVLFGNPTYAGEFLFVVTKFQSRVYCHC